MANILSTFTITLSCLLGSVFILPQAWAESTADDAGSKTISVPSGEASPDEITVEHSKINTADASPVDPGHYEIEPSYSFTSARRFWNGSGNIHSRGGLFQEQNINVSVTRGLVENADVNVSGGYSWLRDNSNNFDEDAGFMGPSTGSNFTDLAVSGRYRFYNNEKQHLEIAYIAGVTIPTGSSSDKDDIGTSQEYWSFDQILVASKDWGQWTLNGDVGFSLPIGNKRRDARGSLIADLALGYQILPWLQPEVELNYGHDYLHGEGDAQTFAVTIGLVMPLNDTWRVNIGIQQGVWGENADKATTGSVSVKYAF